MKQLKNKIIESFESGMFLVYYFAIPSAAYFIYVAFEIFSK